MERDCRKTHVRNSQTPSDIINNIVVIVAAIIGGVWALNRLKRERADEAALEMIVSVTSFDLCAPSQNSFLVNLTVQLTNKGKTKIEAKTDRTNGGYIFDDGPEKLKHSCSLQIRRIDENRVAGPQSLDWFEGGPWQDILLFRGGSEINALIDYENPLRRDSVGMEILEFWMEPGETYRAVVPVVLPKGTYIGKLTFVGADQERSWLDKEIDQFSNQSPRIPCVDQNFWSQIFAFKVPT